MSMASLSPRPTGGNQFGDAESDLPALGAALWRNKWQIIRPTVLAALIAIAVVEMIPPKYQSEARVLIEGRDNVFLRPNAERISSTAAPSIRRRSPARCNSSFRAISPAR